MEHIAEVRELLEERFGLLNLEDSLIFIFYLEGYRYIARDIDGDLWVYEGHIKKGPFCWVPIKEDDSGFKCVSNIGQYLFDHIKWEDEEPFSIDSYIGENLFCEDNIE